MSRPLEYCVVCDDPTGRAGAGEDSLYCEHCDAGPFCSTCFDEHEAECPSVKSPPTTDWDRDDIAMDEMLALVSGGGEDMREWLSRNRKPSPTRLAYHAFEQGMHAGIVGYNHKRDCPYATNDYRMWWMHGCIVGNERRLPASPPLSDDERQELERSIDGKLDEILGLVPSDLRQHSLGVVDCVQRLRADWERLLNENHLMRHGRIAALEAELSKSQAFKTWVHSFLDGKCVPTDPDPDANAKHGCRISGRFKWLFAELAQARAEVAKAKRQVDFLVTESTIREAYVRDVEQRATAAEAERIKYREAISHAAFALCGDGQQKLAAAEADFMRLMDELGIDWNGEQVAPQAEKPT